MGRDAENFVAVRAYHGVIAVLLINHSRILAVLRRAVARLAANVAVIGHQATDEAFMLRSYKAALLAGIAGEKIFMRFCVADECAAIQALRVMHAAADIHAVDFFTQFVIVAQGNAVTNRQTAFITEAGLGALLDMRTYIDDCAAVEAFKDMIHTFIPVFLTHMNRRAAAALAAEDADAGLDAAALALMCSEGRAAGGTSAVRRVHIIGMREFLAHEFAAAEAKDGVLTVIEVNPIVPSVFERIIVEQFIRIGINLCSAGFANAGRAANLFMGGDEVNCITVVAFDAIGAVAKVDDFFIFVQGAVAAGLAAVLAYAGIGAEIDAEMAFIAAERAGQIIFKVVRLFPYVPGAIQADDIMCKLVLPEIIAVGMIALRLRIVAAECAGSAVGKVMRRCLFEGGLAGDAVDGMEFRIHYLIDNILVIAGRHGFITAKRADGAVAELMRVILKEGGLTAHAVDQVVLCIHSLIDGVEMLAAGLPFIAAEGADQAVVKGMLALILNNRIAVRAVNRMIMLILGAIDHIFMQAAR